MGHPVGHAALRVRTAGTLFQARVPAHLVGAALLARLAVAVGGARVPGALDVRLALEPVGAHAHGPVVGGAALGVLTARRVGRVARVLALPVLARTVGRAVRVRPASHGAHPGRTHVSLKQK